MVTSKHHGLATKRLFNNNAGRLGCNIPFVIVNYSLITCQLVLSVDTSNQ